MIVFQVNKLPVQGDKVNYQGRVYTLTQTPTQELQYLYSAEGKYSNEYGHHTKSFHFELK
jgi:hypothetical protein